MDRPGMVSIVEVGRAVVGVVMIDATDSNDPARVVDAEGCREQHARGSGNERVQVLHSACCRPNESTCAKRSLGNPDYLARVVDAKSLTQIFTQSSQILHTRRGAPQECMRAGGSCRRAHDLA